MMPEKDTPPNQRRELKPTTQQVGSVVQLNNDAPSDAD